MSLRRSTSETPEEHGTDVNNASEIGNNNYCVSVKVATRSDANCDSPFNSSITAGAPQLRAPGSHTAADSLVYNEASWRQKRLPHNAATDGRTIQPFAVALGDAGPMSAARDAARLHPAEGLTEGDASSLKQEGQSAVLSPVDSCYMALGASPMTSAASPSPSANLHAAAKGGGAGGSEVLYDSATPPVAYPVPLSGPSEHRDSSSRRRRSDSAEWMDTATMWSNVQTRGEELQRRRRLQPASSSCTGVDWMAGPRRLHKRVRTQLVVTARVVVKDPMTAIIPLVVLVCLLAFGLWGVFSVAYALRDGRRQAAINAAQDLSQTLTSHILATVAPASTAKMIILLERQVPTVNASFHRLAPDLVRKETANEAVITIVLLPQGIVTSIVPVPEPDSAWYQVYNYNLLNETRWRSDALKTIRNYRQGMVMTGPSLLRAGMMGIVCRYAVFVANATQDELFGGPGPAHECGDVCWERTGQLDDGTPVGNKFWGFAQLNVDWEVLTRNVSRLYDLCDRDGLAFNMTYIDPVTGVNRTIAHDEECGPVGKDPVWVHVDVMLNHWVLAVTDRRGWTPEWLPVVVAVVVVVSLWVAVAMAVIMINRREHMWLLQAMLPQKVIATLRRGEDYVEAFEYVTVLFSDIVSYTTMASEMDPLQVVRLLNRMYSAYDALVDDYACYKVETIGDAFMAVCGTQGEDRVAAAVKVARLAQAMVARTRELVSDDGQKVQIRIGLHSGPVVGAVVGFKMPHFCLCGDTVNTASRMESNSKPMRIHVSGATHALLAMSGERFAFDERGPIDVKGKGKMHTWWLLPDNDQQPGAAHKDSPHNQDHDHANNGDGNGNGSGPMRHRATSNPPGHVQPTGDAEAPSLAPPTPRWPFLYGSRRNSNRNDMGNGADGRHTGGSFRGGHSFSGTPDLPLSGRSKAKASVDLRLFQAGQGRGQN